MDPEYWEDGVLGTRIEHQARREQAQREARLQRERELTAQSKDDGGLGLDGGSLATGLLLGMARRRQIEREEQTRKPKTQEQLWLELGLQLSTDCLASSKTGQQYCGIGPAETAAFQYYDKDYEQLHIICTRYVQCNRRIVMMGSVKNTGMAKNKHYHIACDICDWQNIVTGSVKDAEEAKNKHRHIVCDICDWQNILTGSVPDANLAKKKHLRDHWRNGECSWWRTDGPLEVLAIILIFVVFGGILASIAYGIFHLLT